MLSGPNLATFPYSLSYISIMLMQKWKGVPRFGVHRLCYLRWVYCRCRSFVDKVINWDVKPHFLWGHLFLLRFFVALFI